MTEQELKALLDAEERNAVGYLSGELSQARTKAMDYYLGEPFGNEVEGESKVVSTDVADTVEWILPSLLKVFTASDEIGRAEPTGPEDEDAAKQATEYANFVLMRDNPGFVILHNWFKDALLAKNGIIKCWWEETTDEQREEVGPLDDDAWGVEVQQRTEDGWMPEDQEPAGGGQVRGAFRRSKKRGKVCIENVPPEEFLISRNAKSIDDASYVGHRRRWTESELIDAGYDRDIVKALGSDDADTNEERATRNQDIDETNLDEGADLMNRSQRRIWVTEAYVKCDWNGDGISEMRKVTHGRHSNTILDNEEWKGPRPFLSVTPILMPHRFFGRSVADIVMDLQLIKSTLWRQILNNLYLSNNPRHAISDQVNVDDFLVSKSGGVVRMLNGAQPAGHILPLQTPFVAGAAFPMLEYVDSVRENRTGVTRYNQGIDANSLNKTASGISQIMTASQARIELIARIFAETGVKGLFSMIIWNLKRYKDQAERTLRLRNKWVPMSPATWPADFDMQVSVGLGTGNKDQMTLHLSLLGQMQEKIVMMQGGPKGPLVTMENIYALAKAVVENAMGKAAGDKFVTDPQTQAPPQPAPDPEMIKAQAKIEEGKAKLALDAQKAKQDAELQMAQAQQEAALEEQRMRHEMQLEEMKANAAIRLKRAEMEATLTMKREEAQQNASIRAAEAEHGARLKAWQVANAPQKPASGAGA
jgi:hypothetical protein